MFIEIRKREKEKEQRIIKEREAAQLEKRKLAESKMERRIKALQKIQEENRRRE